MSYDVYLEDERGNYHLDLNYTSNCAPMWRDAGADLGRFNGKAVSQCQPILWDAILVMVQNPTRYREMEPSNGWGHYSTCLEFLCRIHEAMRENPTCRVLVSR